MHVKNNRMYEQYVHLDKCDKKKTYKKKIENKFKWMLSSLEKKTWNKKRKGGKQKKATEKLRTKKKSK